MTLARRPGTRPVGASGMAPASRGRRIMAVGTWLALFGGAVLTLHAAGAVLPGPPLLRPSAWPRWAAGGDPVIVAFAVVRLLALAAAWYGLVVTAAGVGLRLAPATARGPAEHLASLVDRLTVGPLRRMVAAAVTVGISTGPLAAAGAGPLTTPVSVPSSATAAGPPVTVTMHLLGPSGPPSGMTGPGPGPGPGPAVPPPPSPVVTTEEPSQPQPEPETAASATWTVRPGQCFWSIADDVLGGAWGRPPTDAEIVPYWHRLIEANRAALSDPHNPDLVFPGQVFSLPDV